MAYSLPLVAPNVFILKLKVHCSRCENKLKRQLLEVQGVQSVIIDAKQGTVTISGTVDPSTILKLIETVGRKAEVLWAQRPSTDQDQNLQIVAQSKVVDQFNDPDVVAQLQQLSGIKGLKNLEVTYSKTIKLTFRGPKDDPNDKNVEISIKDGVYGSQVPHDGGGFCGASASCCGGHHTHHPPNNNIHGSHGCCRGHLADYCPIHSRNCSIHNNYSNLHSAPPPCGSNPPPGSNIYSPSAPPYDPPAPPPPSMGYPYYTSPFSDDNTGSSCTIM